MACKKEETLTMKKTPEELARIKAVAIADVLNRRGHRPHHHEGTTLVYHSPLRDERTPSFKVDTRQNRYTDFGTADRQRDVIDLVMQLDGCTWAQAVETLAGLSGTFTPTPELSSSLQANSQQKQPGCQLLSVKLLNQSSLTRYAEGRGIGPGNARTYLREVYFRTPNGKNLYGIGMETDLGSHAVRMTIGDRLKWWVGASAITTIAGADNRAVSVFEGMFDFLAALEYYGLPAPRCPAIILHSTANLRQALPALSGFDQVNAYLDHDNAGRTALSALQTVCKRPVNALSGTVNGCKQPVNDPSAICKRPVNDCAESVNGSPDTCKRPINGTVGQPNRVVDRSIIYEGHKDFNEFWIAKQQ